jgi:hypothetical protein
MNMHLRLEEDTVLALLAESVAAEFESIVTVRLFTETSGAEMKKTVTAMVLGIPKDAAKSDEALPTLLRKDISAEDVLNHLSRMLAARRIEVKPQDMYFTSSGTSNGPFGSYRPQFDAQLTASLRK